MSGAEKLAADAIRTLSGELRMQRELQTQILGTLQKILQKDEEILEQLRNSAERHTHSERKIRVLHDTVEKHERRLEALEASKSAGT